MCIRQELSFDMAFCLTRLSATQGCAIVRNGLEWVGLALCARRTSKTLDMQTGYNDDANVCVCVYMYTMYTYRLYKSIYIYSFIHTYISHTCPGAFGAMRWRLAN